MNNSLVQITRSYEAAKSALDGAFVVTDDNVARLYAHLLDNAAKTVILPHGEDSKTLETVENILCEMAAARLDRKSTLVALGGGVVGDIAGFAASVYMRGIKWVNVPTTLLAQLDSSIGGKTGVDLKNYKNMVGAFHLPEKVIICTDFLKTLPEREVLCGLGEGFKTALLDADTFKVWYSYGGSFGDGTDLFELVKTCATFKKNVTEADFKEGNLRKILNLGHTVGHALEYLDSHILSHGEYIAVGLAVEAGLGVSAGKVTKKTYDRILSTARALSKNFSRLVSSYDGMGIAAAATADKKNSGGKISVMLSENFKQCEIMLGKDELAREIDTWRSNL